jgi:hypothetical protein
VALVRLAQVQTIRALDADLPAGELARAGLEAARASGWADLVTEAEMLLLEAEPPDSGLAEQAEALIARKGSARPQAVAVLRLACATAVILAERSQTAAARPFFERGQRLLAELGAQVPETQLRVGFLKAYGRLLLKAVRAQHGELPLFMGLEQAPTQVAHWKSLVWALLGMEFLAIGLLPSPTRNGNTVLAEFMLLPLLICAVSLLGIVTAIITGRGSGSRITSVLGGLINLFVLLALLVSLPGALDWFRNLPD